MPWIKKTGHKKINCNQLFMEGTTYIVAKEFRHHWTINTLCNKAVKKISDDESDNFIWKVK